MTIKKLSIAAIAAVAVMLSGCAADAGESASGETLVIYSTESTMPEFAERFQSETGIELQVVSVSSGQSDARVAAEKDNPQTDVAISGSSPADSNPELYRAYEGSIDVSNVDERWIRGEYAIPTILNPVIFGYNTEVLDGRAAPSSWEELGDEQWRGEVSIADPTQSGSAFNALAAVYAAGGWPLVEKFAQNVVIAQSSLGPIQAISNGEAAIGIGAEASVYQVADGEDIVAGYPTDGIVVNVGMFYLVENSSNPESADAFMNWMLSSDTQTWMQSEHKGMRSTTTDSETPDTLQDLSTLDLIEVPADVLADKAAFLDEWTTILTSVN